jgi:hypothetical protein
MRSPRPRQDNTTTHPAVTRPCLTAPREVSGPHTRPHGWRHLPRQDPETRPALRTERNPNSRSRKTSASQSPHKRRDTLPLKIRSLSHKAQDSNHNTISIARTTRLAKYKREQ